MSLGRADTVNSTNRKSANSNVTVFHVGPQDQDLRALAEILDGSDWQMCPDTSWTLSATDDLPSAVDGLQGSGVSIVLCGREGASCTWKDVLEHVGRFPAPPMVIVASRTADEYLWAEALNLGAYDVLSKPYHPAEVIRVLSLAWLHWMNRHTNPLALAQAS
jgi:CheY-like chemotaxis protein